jgi:glucose/arabinose dehydrogenase
VTLGSLRPGRPPARPGHAVVRLVGPLVLVLAMLLAGAPAASQPSPPAGFVDELVAVVPNPTALDVAPDGAIYVASKGGALHRIPAGGDPVSMDIQREVCAQGERGLLGVALDPAFETNRRLYLYLTEKDGDDCFNRVYRYETNGDGTLDAASGTRLLSTARLDATNHNAGDLHFGADGRLYASIGENGRPSLAQQRDTLFGKIVRIDTGGNPAPGNPFGGAGSQVCGDLDGATGTDPCAEIFALGLRNPFRFAFAEDGERFLINDVGQGTWEEIDEGRAGANYGWPRREGPCRQGQVRKCRRGAAAFDQPVHAYRHRSGCRSITGGAFVPDGNGWGPLEGDYLFADFICGRIFALDRPFGDDPKRSVFVEDAGQVIALRFHPDEPGTLLYTTFDNGGEVRSLSPVDVNP